jgi:hypothetical protein
MSYSDFKTIDQTVSILLEKHVVKIDLAEYFLTQLNQILGILAEPFRIYCDMNKLI